jgi:hypothetical protein
MFPRFPPKKILCSQPIRNLNNLNQKPNLTHVLYLPVLRRDLLTELLTQTIAKRANAI